MAKSVYTPSFSWKNNAIYDYDDKIATFKSYPGKENKSVRFNNMKLVPGGEEILSWWMIGRGTHVLKTLKVDDKNHKELIIGQLILPTGTRLKQAKHIKWRSMSKPKTLKAKVHIWKSGTMRNPEKP